MNVYHGSSERVTTPDIAKSRERLDFGKGFYVTNIKDQALRWTDRFVRNRQTAYLNHYDLDYDALVQQFNGRRFEVYNEQWLDFVVECRMGKTTFKQYDFVEGGVANDRIFNTIELYFDHLIPKTECLKRLSFEQPNHQICLITPQAITHCLHYLGAEPIH